MINIIKQEIPIDESLKKKLDETTYKKEKKPSAKKKDTLNI